jgi:broad specificity phosphatase PhoE
MRNHNGSPITRRVLSTAIAAITAVMLFLVGAVPAWAGAITVTFVRHGQSAGNAAGVIDTSVPGPVLTPLGHQEADAAAEVLKNNGYDAIYASNMIRTQQTAAPLADALGLDVVVLPGFREISAGIFEGSSEKEGLGRIAYGLGPITWVLGLRSLPIPGSTDGNAFDARVDDALQTVYASGAQKPVVFAHGATIMFWVMMNVDNPDPLLLLSHPLANTSVVVVNGSPEEGWTLENWDGVDVAADPSFGTKLFVNVRDLVTTPQTSLYRIVKALETGNVEAVAHAVRDGVVDVATAPAKFIGAVARDVVDELHGPTPSQQPDPLVASTVTSEVTEDDQAGEPQNKVRKKATPALREVDEAADEADVTDDAVTDDDVTEDAVTDHGATEDVTATDTDTDSEGTDSEGTDPGDADTDSGTDSEPAVKAAA